MTVLHETCQQYFQRRLSEGWKLIGLKGHNAVLLSPDGIRREVNLRNDTETLRPNAVGSETSIESCNQPEHWQAVDDVSPDGMISYVRNITVEGAYQRDLYNLPASSGSGTINFVKVYFCAQKDVSGADAYARPALRSDTTVTDGTEIILTTAWVTHSQQWSKNPADSEDWEWADIDALQIGVSLRLGTKPPYQARCTQVYVEVDYTPVAAGRSFGFIFG